MEENPYKAPDEADNATDFRSDWRLLAIVFYWMPVVVLGAIAVGLALSSDIEKAGLIQQFSHGAQP